MNEQVNCLVREEVKQLAAKGKVSLAIWEQLKLNSYERWTLYPVLTDKCLLHVLTEHQKQIQPFNQLPSTYEETCLHVLLPILMQRFSDLLAARRSLEEEIQWRINNDPIVE